MSTEKRSKTRRKKRKPKKMNGTSEFSARNPNYDFYPTDSSNNTGNFRRDRYFQFNNRNIDFGRYDWQRSHWYDSRGIPKSWHWWPPNHNNRVRGGSPPVPASTPSRYYWQTVNPKPASNLTVTIPNFSGVRRPDVFTFGNSSASKPAQFAKPAFSNRSVANKNVRNVVLESKEADLSDDVQYLYTVQTKGGELVEVVDLAEDSEASNRSKLRAFDPFLSSNKASSDAKECGNERILEKDSPSSEKQYAAPKRGKKRKNSSEDLQCDICARDYDTVRSRGGEIFKARCEHMFCQECLKELDPYKCPECDLYLQKLLKVFL